MIERTIASAGVKFDVSLTRALLEKEIADINAMPTFFNFVVCGTRDFSPVYQVGNRLQIYGELVARFSFDEARKVAANFNRQAADTGEDLQTYRVMSYENWAPARVTILRYVLDKLAVLD